MITARQGSVRSLCQQAPHHGLALIERLSPEVRNKPSICFGKFIALRTLALGHVVGSVNLTGVETAELARLMKGPSLGYAIQALGEVLEIERLHPGYIVNLGTPDDPFGEQSMDDICIVVERLFPGRVQETLGWTKIFYFGIDRIGFVRKPERCHTGETDAAAVYPGRHFWLSVVRLTNSCAGVMHLS